MYIYVNKAQWRLFLGANAFQTVPRKLQNFDLYTRERWLVFPGPIFKRASVFKSEVQKHSKSLPLLHLLIQIMQIMRTAHRFKAIQCLCTNCALQGIVQLIKKCTSSPATQYIQSYFLKKKKLPKIFDCATSAALYMRVI